MLEYLKSADDVLAFRLGGKLDDGEFDDLVERVEAMLKAHDKTHMYMEVVDFAGFDWRAYLHHLPRSFAMLGQLARFGRIAVVADQSWIRVWTRIESALLPGIRYELYGTSERDEALAWVEGRRERPHDPSIRFLQTDDPDVVAFELSGRIRADEIDGIAAIFNEAMERGQPINVLGRIKRLEGAEWGTFFNREYLEMKLRGLRNVRRYALVGGPDWLSRLAAMLDPLLQLEIRHFTADEEDAAWQWVGAQPKPKSVVKAPAAAVVD